MKYTLLILLFCLATQGFSQNPEIDRLTRQLASVKQDTSRVLLMVQLVEAVRFEKPGLATRYAQQALALARKIHFARGESRALGCIGYNFRELGNLPKALELTLQALRIAQDHHYLQEIAIQKSRIGNIYFDLRDYSKSIAYGKESLQIGEKLHDNERIAIQFHNIGSNYLYSGQLDSAQQYILQAKGSIFQQKVKNLYSSVFRNLGLLAEKQGHSDSALAYYRQSVQNALAIKDARNAAYNYSRLAALWLRLNKSDSCISNAQSGLGQGQKGPFPLRILQNAELLTAAYKQKRDFAHAFAYQELMLKTREGLFGAGNIQAMQTIIANEEKRQQEAQLAKEAYQTQIRQVVLLGGLGALLLIAYILYRYSRQQQKANLVLQKTLADLHTTQAQLIQKEKMASLGELTAGIAHEIQNPLNFVNNFAEVSVELAEELLESVRAGHTDSAQELATDLQANMHHIAQNGQRAAGIVRAMLEHSRTSTGEHQPTDLNALCEEYLRLAYQGVRAKDPSFNCQLETHFDPDLPQVSVVASDMSRVLLNLYNNAFYAVGQKQQTAPADYQPTVIVSTALLKETVEIRVQDNGVGIANAIKEKVFQPFFTTKPTGKGTGLGLSLSYDIVTKGHGGEMWVEENTFTEFVITLPFLT